MFKVCKNGKISTKFHLRVITFCLQLQPFALTSARRATAAAVRSASTLATATTAPAVLDIDCLQSSPTVHSVWSFSRCLSTRGVSR